MAHRKSKELNEELFKAIIEQAYGGIVVYDGDGIIQYASPGIKKVIGYNERELIGRNGIDFIHPESVEEARTTFRSLCQQPGQRISLTHRLRHKRGHYFWTEAQMTNFLHVPEIGGIISTFWDVHDRKVAEEKLFETQHLLETINQNLSEGIFMGIVDKKFLYANDSFLRMLGYRTFSDLQKRKPQQLYANRAFGRSLHEKLIQAGRVRNVEVLFTKKDGRKFWVRLTISRLQYKGNENCFVGSVRDITQQKKVKQELLNSHHFLRNVINTVAAPIFVKDRKHRWVMFNEAFKAGRDEKMILYKTDHDVFPKKIADGIWKADNEVFRTGHTLSREEMLPGEDKSRTVVTTKSLFVNDKGEKFIIGFIMDITDRKQFENIVTSINARLRGILESTKDEILAIDKNASYIMFNRAHADSIRHATGCEIKIGDNLLSSIPQVMVKDVRRHLKRALKGEEFTTELVLPSKVVLKVSFNAIKEKGEVTGVAIFAEDITDRKTTEARMQALNDELTEQNWQLASQEEDLKTALDQLSERNFELDQLMYKTSHDLRSPLSSIMGLVNLALIDPEPEQLTQYLNKIEARIKKLDEFISSMLYYARVNRGDVNIEKIDLGEVAHSAIRELEYLESFGEIQTSVEIEPGEVPFYSDLFRIRILFSNIISNAYKYYNPEVASYLKIRIVVNPARAIVEFADNGIGIKDEYKDKIFNMFFRATERSQGSGLGMYIVRQAVEKLNGSVSIDSEFGKGSSIQVVIPNR